MAAVVGISSQPQNSSQREVQPDPLNIYHSPLASSCPVLDSAHDTYIITSLLIRIRLCDEVSEQTITKNTLYSNRTWLVDLLVWVLIYLIISISWRKCYYWFNSIQAKFFFFFACSNASAVVHMRCGQKSNLFLREVFLATPPWSLLIVTFGATKRSWLYFIIVHDNTPVVIVRIVVIVLRKSTRHDGQGGILRAWVHR